ncbi:hypothetical protein FA95DRAFT_1640530 [Auriscalpium vulgare]|uniref:Uncharacterized protein n=1 Tax=Auriscalpium vulgare TaxID=40419 RepID=A0ACB8S2B3_9AGAM|nr:hypothetical protein FA95DRAFT_1640530 [Auriscalpium vulgare]
MPSSLPPPSERASTSNHHNSSNGGRAAAAGPSRAPSRRITNVAVPTNLIDTEHGHLLATKWMSTRKLKEMAESEGLVYKKGKFSMIEEQQLASAIEAYKSSTGIDDAAFSELVFAKDVKSKDNSFWSDLTSAVPMRPIIAVYHHVRRIYHPMGNRGSWMPAEDEALRAAVAEYGQQWENVSIRVNRRAADCRDRYRNHLQYSEGRTSGAWTKEEEDMLTQIVTEMTLHQGKDMDNDVFWGAVSLRMGSTRGRQQCRIKWTDSLSKTVKNRGNKPRWNAEDGYILVHKVDSLHVHDDTEIDWKTLPDAHWNFWSAHTLQRRWLTMKRSVRGYAEMSHAELMDILRVKKAHLPPTKQKVVSAEAVEDSEEEVDEEQGEGSAGPTGVPPPTMPAKAVRIAGLSRRDGSDDSDSNSS